MKDHQQRVAVAVALMEKAAEVLAAASGTAADSTNDTEAKTAASLDDWRAPYADAGGPGVLVEVRIERKPCTMVRDQVTHVFRVDIGGACRSFYHVTINTGKLAPEVLGPIMARYVWDELKRLWRDARPAGGA